LARGIEPEINWLLEIRQLCAELQIPGEVLAPFADLVLPEEPEQRAQARREMVYQIAESVFQHLSRGHAEQQSSPPNLASNQFKDANDARDAWVYKHCCKGTPYKEIISQLKNRKGWLHVATLSGIRDVAKRYAERHALPSPPKRYGGNGSEE
jgi:hypothetical protein